MAYVPTTFVDRSVEFPSRRKLTAVSGLADTFDVARAEGTVFAEGTKPDAANLNAEFGKIKTETDAINQSLNTAISITNQEHIIGTWGGTTLYSVHKIFTYTGNGWLTNQQILAMSPTNAYIDMQNSYFSNGTYIYPLCYAESGYENFARVRPDKKSLDFYLGTGHASGGTFAIAIRYWK